MSTPAWEDGQLHYCDKDHQRIDELKAPEGLAGDHMTKAEIVELLNKHTYVTEEIRNCGEEIQRLTDVTSGERGLKSTVTSGMPGNRSRKNDPTYKKAQRILDEYCNEIDRIEKRQKGLFEQHALVEEIMGALPTVERKVVELRYFKKYKWWMISSQLGYHERHCRRIVHEALHAIELRYKND
jgi:hypothetical protein